MSKPVIHSRNSVRRYGGVVEDYLPIHDFIDQTKSHYPGSIHRFGLHHSYGTFLVERVFGHVLENSDGGKYSPRDIAEQHSQEDFVGFIPTLQDYFELLNPAPWMYLICDYDRLSCQQHLADKFGGVAEFYKPLVDLLDQPRLDFPAIPFALLLSHNSWFSTQIVDGILGNEYINAVELAQEVIKFRVGEVPSLQEVLVNFKNAEWLNNGRHPWPKSCAHLQTAGGRRKLSRQEVSIID